MRLLSFFWAAALLSYAGAFIVPDQLVSLLTVVYSVIPPIKKGSDSRVGFGYRFGPFGDVQVLLELGPQSETRAIGQPPPSLKRDTDPQDPQVPDDADPAKRPALQVLDDVPSQNARMSRSRSRAWARSVGGGSPREQQLAPRATAPPPPAPARADWLSRWRSGFGLPVDRSGATWPLGQTPAPTRAPPPAPAPAPQLVMMTEVPVNVPVSVPVSAPTRAPRPQAPAQARWEAMRRLRSLYWLGQQGAAAKTV